MIRPRAHVSQTRACQATRSSRRQLVALLVASTCIPSFVASQTAEASSLPRTASADATAAFGKTISVATGAVESGPWLKWNAASCSFDSVSQHPAAFTFALRKATSPITFGYAEYSSSQAASFIVANNSGIASNMVKAGITEKLVNNNYPSVTDPITAVQDIVDFHSAAAIEGNAVAALYPAIIKRLKQACIPMLTMYLTEPNFPTFGTSWPTAGKVAGQYAAGEIARKGWTPGSVTVFVCADKAVGPSVEVAETTFDSALRAGQPKIPASNYYRIECGPTESTAGAPVSAWIDSHPDVKNMVVFGLNDEITLGAATALTRAGRTIDGNTLAIGTGLDTLGVQSIYSKKETASVTFFPERYGNYMIPLLEAILSGQPVPSASGPPAIGVDLSNIAKYYTKSGKPVG